MDKKITKSSFLYLIKKSNPKYWLFIVGLFTGFFAILIQLVIPQYVSKLVNSIEHGMDFELLVFIVFLYLLVAIASSMSGYILGIFGEKMVFNLRSELWTKLISIKVDYYDKKNTGEITSRLVNDTGQIKFLLSTVFPEAILAFLTIGGTMIFLFSISWKIAGIIFVVLPSIMFALSPLMTKFEKVGEKRQDFISFFTATVIEQLKGIRLVKYSNGETKTNDLIQKQIKNLYIIGKKEVTLQAIVGPLMSTALMILISSLLIFGYSLVAQEEITIGVLISILMYLFQLVGPVGLIGQFISELSEVKGSTQRINEIFEEEEENFSKGELVNIEGKNISIKNLTFEYVKDIKILNNISLQVKKDSLVAIIGPSGGGKSTLFNMIERFYIPNEGSIFVGDKDVNLINLKNWRKQIGFVEQNTTIFSGTVRDNISYGLEREPTDSEIWEALSLANAKRFVYQLSSGLNTEIGENGHLLSGGERQRISIARAFLRDPKILILDEITANLDSESEKMIQKSLETLMRGRTTLVIAHRLSTIIKADNIYFVDSGCITGQGTHEKLYKSHKLYKEYVDLQVTKHTNFQ